jgi:hypothetical protein
MLLEFLVLTFRIDRPLLAVLSMLQLSSICKEVLSFLQQKYLQAHQDNSWR